MIKKIGLAVSSAIVLITLIIFAVAPQGIANAKGMGDFDISGVVVKSYIGNGDSVKIPSNIKEIGPNAFQGSKIKSIYIPSTVEKIDEQAFYDCKKLKEVTIEDGVKAIGVSAFANCEKLKRVEIPASVTSIGAGVFSGCVSLADIDLSDRNDKFFFNDGVLYNNDSTRLIQYLPGRKSTTYEMPFTVSKIDSHAFWGAALLTDVRLSNNVKEIPFHAFSNCTGLTNVFLPESVKRIGAFAFSECTNLSYVGMEAGAVDVAKTAFRGCSSTLVSENGISEADAREEMFKSEDEAVDDESLEDGEQAESPEVYYTEQNDKDIKSGVISPSGVDDNGDVNYRKTFSPINENTQIDTSEKGLIGAGKISGGNALIIPDN